MKWDERYNREEYLFGTEPNDFLAIQESPGIDTFFNQSGDLLSTTTRVLQKIDALLTPIPNDRLENILVNLENSTRQIDHMTKFIDGKSVKTVVTNLSQASVDLKQTSNNLSRISHQVQKGPGTLHSLIFDPSVHDDLKALLGGSQRNKILKYFIRETIREADAP